MNDLIDENLKLFEKSNQEFIYTQDFINSSSSDVVSLMESKDLIETEKDPQKWFLTELGYTIIEEGGWLQHLENVEKKNHIGDFSERLLVDLEDFIEESPDKKKAYGTIKKSIAIWVFVPALILFLYGMLKLFLEDWISG